MDLLYVLVMPCHLPLRRERVVVTPQILHRQRKVREIGDLVASTVEKLQPRRTTLEIGKVSGYAPQLRDSGRTTI
jgi:hypothetical protein